MRAIAPDHREHGPSSRCARDHGRAGATGGQQEEGHDVLDTGSVAKLELGAIADDRPVKLTVELPAAVHRDLLAYADYLNSQHVSVALTEGGDAWRI